MQADDNILELRLKVLEPEVLLVEDTAELKQIVIYKLHELGVEVEELEGD